jgi:hypothetical protein
MEERNHNRGGSMSDAPFPADDRVKYEYRIVWKRHGLHQKSKRYASLKAAERRARLLGPEPWTALEVNPDERMCCSGYECACGGQTWRENLLESRRTPRYPDDTGMPAIEYIRIEKRPVSKWEAHWS